MIGRRARTGAALAAATGLTFVAASPAHAINDIRRFIGVDEAIAAGFNGDTVAIASIEPGHPLASHSALEGQIKLQIHWPFGNSSSIDDMVPRGFISSHATAVTSALAGGGFSDVDGLVRDATVYTGSFASGFDPFTGNFEDLDSTAVAFALLALTDQPLADAIAARTQLAPYQAATVVNTSFGNGRSDTNASGEDRLSRIYNAVAFITDATLVASVGNDGQFEPPDTGNQMEEFGTAFAPSTAYNVIGVGYLGTDGSPREVNMNSSGGGSQGTPAIDFVEAAMLFPEEEMPPDDGDDGGDTPEDTTTVFGARPGVDIVAPAFEVRLAGSPVPNTEFVTTAVSDIWTGSSFASSVVAGVCALVHDIGNKENLWPTGRPSNVVTRAVLLNAADRTPAGGPIGGAGFDTMPGEAPNPLGGQPDDERQTTIFELPYSRETGAGEVSVPRTLDQFMANIPDIRPGDQLVGEPLSGFTFNPATETYDIATLGTDPNVPFVTERASLFGRAPIGVRSRDYARRGRSSHRFRIVDDFTVGPIRGRLAQFQNAGNPNVLDRPGTSPPIAGGGTPVSPDFPIAGGGPTTGGGFDDALRTTGWDHGSIGEGQIDIPLGFLSEDADIRITLTWNRQENWQVPDFSAPLGAIPLSDWTAFVSPDALDPQAATARGFDPLQAEPAETIIRPLASGEMAFPDRGVQINRRLDRDGRASAEMRPVSVAMRERGDAAAFEAAPDVGARRADEPLAGAVVAECNAQERAFGIQLVFTPAAQAVPELMDAVINAAAVWESVIRDDKTIRVMIDVGGAETDPLTVTNISGFAGENLYPTIRSRLEADASLFERTLIQALPDQIAFSVPQDLDGSPLTEPDFVSTGQEQVAVLISSANVKAIDAESDVNLDAATFDGTITYNIATDVAFDFDPSDGVAPGDLNVTRASTRLIGQILGFNSGVDAAAGPLGEAGMYFPTPLDFFRFNIVRTSEGMGETETFDGNPNTRADFTAFSRSLSVTEDALFDTVDEFPQIDLNPNTPNVQGEVRFAQGLVVSGEPADSWQQVPFGSTADPLGVFDEGRDLSGADPEIPVIDYISNADKIAMELIGWDTDVFDNLSTSEVPVVDFVTVGDSELGLQAPDPLFQFALQNLDLELWRAADAGGLPPLKVGASRSQFTTVESIALGNDMENAWPQPVGGVASGPDGGLASGTYFIRIIWERTAYDFGGFEIPQMLSTPLDSEVVPGFDPFPAAQIEYGLAWWIDQEFFFGDLDGEGESSVRGDFDLDGEVGVSDLNVLLSQWGETGGPADLNQDGLVNSADLSVLLSLMSTP